MPYVEMLGWGHGVSTHLRLVDNLTNLREDVVPMVSRLFDLASGVFRMRIKEAFSPLYWIDCVVFAPKHLITYLGIDTNKSAAKALNAILTVLWWCGSAVVVFYRGEIADRLISILESQT